MDEQGRSGERPPGSDDGTAAVLYGMLTSFSEALGRFDQRLAAIEQAVRDGPADLVARTERLEASMEGLVVAVEGRQAGLDVLLDTLRSLAGRVESMGARMELARERVDEVVQAAGRLPEAADAFRSLEAAVAERAAVLDPDSLTELVGLVRSRTEAVERHLDAVTSDVGALRRLLQAHVDETAHSLGRRATDAGRRLAADLGLRGRPKAPPPTGPPGPSC